MCVKTDAGEDPLAEAHMVRIVQMSEEEEIRATACNVIMLYDSGKLKDQIAELLNLSLNDIEDIIAHREVLGR